MCALLYLYISFSLKKLWIHSHFLVSYIWLFLKNTAQNIDSVTDETGLEEFLAKAELAGTNFTAERGEFSVLDLWVLFLIGVDWCIAYDKR